MRFMDGATTTVPRHDNDCWNVVIAEWLGLDYAHVRKVAEEHELICPITGMARTEKVLRVLGLQPQTIEDDGADGIVRARLLFGNHVLVRCCGQLLDPAPDPAPGTAYADFVTERIIV